MRDPKQDSALKRIERLMAPTLVRTIDVEPGSLNLVFFYYVGAVLLIFFASLVVAGNGIDHWQSWVLFALILVAVAALLIVGRRRHR